MYPSRLTAKPKITFLILDQIRMFLFIFYSINIQTGIFQTIVKARISTYCKLMNSSGNNTLQITTYSTVCLFLSMIIVTIYTSTMANGIAVNLASGRLYQSTKTSMVRTMEWKSPTHCLIIQDKGIHIEPVRIPIVMGS